ncbi:Histidine biosynthesis bifunctional protein HisIE [Buchnera aphidicola (Thelaxes suberi)]|uniref:bifunctional phosphoribosyl-AMP cyclohydrolase/phosphoribosyl-ATP diphosphatase HisIE n=1 Tax=Buchnera aphidicola TaxID=9 RepID=UPI0034641E59
MLITLDNIAQINWDKNNNKNVPAIIQNFFSGEVLMHAFMNYEALQKSIEDQEVTINSRTKKRLWKKGETSGNFLKIKKIITDCDCDSLLIMVDPIGPTCHLNNVSCFYSKESSQHSKLFFLHYLDKLIELNKKENNKNSYTYKLFLKGKERIAQKLGEESIETIIASMQNDREKIINESSDLMYHFLVLLHEHNMDIYTIISRLQKRHQNTN